MRLPLFSFVILAAAGCSAASAQDLARQEIVVTAQRMEQDDYSDYRPAVGLRREADFLVQEVVIRGDTRDDEQRGEEIRAMLADAVRRAGGAGVELAYGDYILTPLTSENVDDITLERDSRPDSQRLVFLVKARLAGEQTGEQAERQIDRFLEAVPEVGRAQIDKWGDSTLSIVGPDGYRPQIAALIAEDARQMAGLLGDGYSVEITGLNMPVQWAAAGPGEVLLYIPYELKVVPTP